MLQVHNTLSGSLELFEPLEKGKVRMYVCGPTVYDHPHIGHGRVYVIFDTVVRYLRYRGYDVSYTRNITDIDDKIIKRANERNIPFEELAQTYTDSFHEDMNTLGLQEPDHEPKASETIDEIIAMVEKLIEDGKAYESHGDVYFKIETSPEYGKLSKKKLKDLKAGARVDPGEQKKDPLDFALWKAAKPEEPCWTSPWGDGRPGWHIECSAMVKKLLGETIDIHAGGLDLIFPHHENEIAQSEGANEKPFVKYWLHNGFVNINKEKMSKSLGNIVTLKKLFEQYSPEALKLYILSSHYRSPMDFADTAINEAARGLARMYRVLLAIPDREPKADVLEEFEKAFVEAMDDDFNTAKALGVLFDAVRKANKLQAKSDTLEEAIAIRSWIVKAGGVLGLLMSEPKSYFHTLPGMDNVDVEKIEGLLAERSSARREKNYDRADQIRDELQGMNIEVEDSPDGTSWHLVSS